MRDLQLLAARFASYLSTVGRSLATGWTRRSTIALHCDQPALDAGARVASTFHVEGWAVARNGVAAVAAFVDERPAGTLEYGLARPDVGRHFPGLPGAAESGFRGCLDLGALPAGSHRLRFTVTDRSGASRDLVGTFELDHSRPPLPPPPLPDYDAQYQHWLEAHALRPAYLKELAGAAARLGYRPTFSLLTPTYNTSLEYLREAVESVRAQVYPEWELCLVDDASPDDVVRALLEELAGSDPRIRVLFSPRNQGIAGASNASLAMARGEFVGLLDHDDVLWPNALYECARLLNEQLDLDLIYTDEDKVTADGSRHYEAYFKSDWSPDHLLSTMYTGHFSVYRRQLVLDAGGFRAEYSGSQDHDLALRAVERTDRIAHIPKVLYSWRAIPGSAAADIRFKLPAVAAGGRALLDAAARRGLDVGLEPGFTPGVWRLRYRIAGSPSVALVMPTAGDPGRLEPALRSLLEQTAYARFEIVVADRSGDQRARGHIEEMRGSLFPLPFREGGEGVRSGGGEGVRSGGGEGVRSEGRARASWSAVVNAAVAQTDASYIGIVADALAVGDPGWLVAMLEHAGRPEVGVVGAKLLYADGSVQHAGVVLGLGGVCGHLFHRFQPNQPGPFGLVELVRNVSAVTFDCALFRREVFAELGGLDAGRFPEVLGGVDFCLRAGQRGYRIVYTPYAVLYHHDWASGTFRPSEAEAAAFRAAWGDLNESDPFYNPNLTLARADRSIVIGDRRV